MVQDVHVELNQDCHGKSSIQQDDSFHQRLDFNLRKKQLEWYIWSLAL